MFIINRRSLVSNAYSVPVLKTSPCTSAASLATVFHSPLDLLPCGPAYVEVQRDGAGCYELAHFSRGNFLNIETKTIIPAGSVICWRLNAMGGGFDARA